MRLLVNKTEVEVNYTPFQQGGSAVLHLFLQESDERDALHPKLAEDLGVAYRPGVKDRAEVVDGCTEIRLLGASMLEAIDLMRMLGYAVREVHPYP